MSSLSAGARLLVGASLCLLCLFAAVWAAISQPWLGLRLEATPEAGVTVVGAEGPSRGVPVGARLLALGAPGEELALEATDLVEDPDAFDRYEDMGEFFARQGRLAAHLRAEHVQLVVDRGEGPERVTVAPLPRRPSRSLPLVFWFQLFVGGAGFFVGAWVWVLRPGDLAARLFAAMGWTFPMFTATAAIYSTRELALDGALFTALSSVNLIGAVLFGCGLVALFLVYPRRLVPPKSLWIIPLVYVPWVILSVLRLMPDQNTGARLAVLSEMLLAIALGFVQLWATRGDARDRAALRWLGLSILVGSGLFVFTSVVTRLFGWFPPLRQGYAFGFFLLMDVGLALGLRRYRLFELDEWAYRVLMWVGGALLLLALDGAFLFYLELSATTSLGLALLLASFLYLPLRGLLWQRMVARRDVDQPALFKSLLEVSFGVTEAERSDRWVALVRRVFDPLVLEPADDASAITRASLDGDGLALSLPAVASTPPLRVAHPWGGRALFGPRHLRLAESVVSILGVAEERRDAYDRGVREERVRIARDLHDDVGARLLSGLQETDLDRARAAMRRAISEMRSIVTALTGTRAPLDDLLGDLRHETQERLTVAGLTLAWPLHPAAPETFVSAHVSRHLVSMLREVISNVIRHAEARRVEVDVRLEGTQLCLSIVDDGAGFTQATGDGHGLDNLRQRAQAAGGELTLPNPGEPSALGIRVPVEGGP